MLRFNDWVSARDLRLADTVLLDNDAWSTAVVRKIDDGLITLYRPYVHTGDFSYTGGVICYLGLEEFNVMRDSDRTYHVIDRKALR